MTGAAINSDFEVGYNIPAEVGMAEGDIQTPCLLIDLDAFEKNVERMRSFCAESGIALCAHGKMHKSADVARYQIEHGGAVGICCQKVSEAEAFVRAGINDILITNQVRDPRKLQRLAALPNLGARVLCCIDDLENVAELAQATTSLGTMVECLVELDCGAGRCGVTSPVAAAEIAEAIDTAKGLTFAGIQAYNGDAQHLHDFKERKRAYAAVEAFVIEVIEALKPKDCTAMSSVVEVQDHSSSKLGPTYSPKSNVAPTRSWTQPTARYWMETASSFPGIRLNMHCLSLRL